MEHVRSSSQKIKCGDAKMHPTESRASTYLIFAQGV